MAEAEEFAQLPLTEQFVHKNWKARKGGYETATKEFKVAQPSDPTLREFILDSGLWKGAVADSNVAAQQEALNAYNAFLDAAGAEGAKKTRASTVTPIVEKGLTGRPVAKAAALEALLLLIELDKPDPILEELLPLLSHKLPKIITATLGALKEIYHAYGCKTVEPKSILKLLPKVYGHADKNVRAEAQALTVELYRWLREAMKPLFWGELKPVQQTDLEKQFEPIKDEPMPKQERLLRSQQAAKEEAELADEVVEEEEIEEEAAIDLEPEFDPVDVLSKVPADFNDRLASSKWKDRKEALEETFAVCNVPLIQEGSFDDIVRGCAKSMKDANIMVVTVAANVIEALAKGLRKPFGRYRSSILPAMLERFKEKKPTVTDAIGAACDAVFMVVGLGDIEADVLEALKNKNPQVRENSARFLVRALKITRDAPTPEQTKEMAEPAKKLLAESAPGLRETGAEILGVLWKIMGDRNMLAHLEGLSDIHKNKVKEASEAAEVKAKWKPKAAPPPKAAAPVAKKPAPGSKRPAVKKAAPKPKPASPPLDEDPPAMAPRPTSRPAAKPAGVRPPGGLKAPGAGLKAPGSGLASPSKRQGMVVEDFPPVAPKSAPGRGLAGRPLGKPAAAPSSPSPPPTPRYEAPSSALSSIERQELYDLRSEIDLVRQQCSDLRTDKMRLGAQISELQNQNAQLIEDHTRDVLQVKAKETQLVRARSDHETAEDRANGLSREIDRLKREITRLSRSQGGRDSPVDSMSGGGYGAHGNGSTPRPNYASSRSSYNMPPPRTYSGENHHNHYGGNSSDGKENMPDYEHGYENNNNHNDSGKPPSFRTTASSGRATPTGDEYGRQASSNNHSNNSHSNNNNAAAHSSMSRNPSAGGDGVESWKRAAEVTQNLKARIEMMKVRSRPAMKRD
jgi:chorismate mutase